jgi:predicted sugar kinase
LQPLQTLLVGRLRSAPADRRVALFLETAVHEILEHGVRVAGLQKPLRRPAAGALGDLFTLVAGGFVVDGVFFSSFAVMSRYVSVTGLI